MFYLIDKNTNNPVVFTKEQLLIELNRDRSDDWSEYTADSTLKEIEEAINVFTEYKTV